MWDLAIGFAIAVAGVTSGHQQQMPRDVHNIPACEAKDNESCALKEYSATTSGRIEAKKALSVQTQAPAPVIDKDVK